MRQIPLTDDAYQSFVLIIDKIEFKFIIAWNSMLQKWAFDVYNNTSGDLVFGGGVITAGLNLLGGVPPFTLSMVFLTKQHLVTDPTRFNLSDGFLFTSGDSDVD